MKPHSFDIDTAKEYTGDSRMRAIEAKARTDADADTYSPPHGLAAVFATHSAGVSAQMDDTVYFNAFSKRKARAQRMAERATETQRNAVMA